jgi:bifunctional non-homologous end joining protein LigD
LRLLPTIAGTGIQFSERFEIDGGQMFALACKLGLEGVVSKIRDGTYPIQQRWQGGPRF